MEFESIISNVNNSPKASLIKNKQFINYIIKCVNINYNVRCNTSVFPAPQPVSIEKKDFIKLQKYKYFTGLKLDGVRFLLFFIKDRNNVNQSIIINRALNCYNINIEADQNIFNGTLLDGEVLFNKETKQWDFMIHDSTILCGNKINKLSHSARLYDTKCCIESYISYGDLSTLNIKVKDFYPFEKFNDFINDVYNKSMDNDGIIFMPENLPVISGTQYSMLKWKPENKHTFDFLIKEIDTGLEAHVFHLNEMTIFAKIHANTASGEKFINNAKKVDGYKDDCILECSFDNKTNNFIPLLVRTDKTHPNSMRTIERTLFNINEGINIADFIDIK
jgi:hypothetical protein